MLGPIISDRFDFFEAGLSVGLLGGIASALVIAAAGATFFVLAWTRVGR